ncbi:hypothetical protein C0J52_20905, partial [Blattella germanica]
SCSLKEIALRAGSHKRNDLSLQLPSNGHFYHWHATGFITSPCPQTRSIDPKDITKFYYCIDLPDSITGHAWIPAQCNYGLVFEPTLKMCVLNKTEACLNKLEDSCIFQSNNSLQVPVETPYTAPDVATILATKLEADSIKVNYSTNRNDFGQESKSTEQSVEKILNDTEHEVHGERSTTKTREIPQNQKNDTQSSYDTIRTPFPFLSTSTPVADLPCTIGVRMPNLTDCTRYYLCNTSSHKINSYSCPPQTFFNPYKYICEANASIWCQGQTTPLRETESSKSFHTTSTTTKPGIHFCNRPGKSPDPTSNKHYYNCYYNSGELEWYRMSCPNNLLFCPVLKICTQPSKCHDIKYGISEWV